MKTQSKTEIRNNTAKATKLLRGIDNEAAAIAKAQDALNKRVASVQKTAAQVSSLLTGISTTALAASTAVAAKPTAKAKPAKPVKKPTAKAKPVKKEAKPTAKAKPAKPVVAKKAEAQPAKPAKAEKVKPAKAEKPVAAKKAEAKPAPAKAGERPPLVQLINNVLDTTPGVTAAEIYKQVVAAAGYFSRQSVYVHLKKSDLYTKTGDGAAATFKRATGAPEKAGKGGTSDEEAEAFAEKAGSNPVTAAVT